MWEATAGFLPTRIISSSTIPCGKLPVSTPSPGASATGGSVRGRDRSRGGCTRDILLHDYSRPDPSTDSLCWATVGPNGGKIRRLRRGMGMPDHIGTVKTPPTEQLMELPSLTS